jgi:hypothetical protein
MDMRFALTVKGATVEFEGNSDLFDAKIKPLCDRLFAIPKSAADDDEAVRGGEESFRQKRVGTINTVIAKLGADSCMDVLKAAAVQLVFYKGKDRFSDDEWDETAKEANAWKADYSNQKAKTKKRLIKSGFVIENAAGIFSLSDASVREMESKLGQ